MKAFMIHSMDHLSQCDMAYVFGNILQVTGDNKKNSSKRPVHGLKHPPMPTLP
jgi:hypothetical protein